MLCFELENDFWGCVRLSGTEPKIKLYMGVKGESLEEADRLVEDLRNGMKEILK